MKQAASFAFEARSLSSDQSAEAMAELYALYEAHAPFLRNAMARLGGPGLDPDDLLQDVFLVALRRQDALGAAREPRAWLYGVAVRVASAARRKARLRRFLGLDAARDVAAHGDPALTFENAESARQVYSALDALNEKKRTVFVLFELEGLSGEEIAQAVGCPLKTVWTRLYHARREFAAALERLQDRSGP